MEASVFRGATWTVLLVSILAIGATCQQPGESSSNPTSEVGPAISSNSNIAANASQPDSSGASDAGQNVDNVIRQLGTPFPLQMRPGGLAIGPFYVTTVTNSGFYQSASPVSGPGTTLWGDVVGANILATHTGGKTSLAFQTQPQMYLAGAQVFVNDQTGFSFIYSPTARWSINANVSLAYYQNQLLTNPQYLLAYSQGGLVLQRVFAQQVGSSMFQSENFSATYQMNGRTNLSLSPEVGVSSADVYGVWEFVRQLGFNASITRSVTPNLSLSANYEYSHSNASGGSEFVSEPSWNAQTMGIGFQDKLGRDWWISGRLAATYQQGTTTAWLPTGNLSVLRSFRRSTLSAAYSRNQAEEAFLSSGYFDQLDVAYSGQFGQKFGVSAGVGAYRTLLTSTHEHGKRANFSGSYRMRPNLAWTLGYQYSQQNGTATSLYNGRTSYFTFGLQWTLGASVQK